MNSSANVRSIEALEELKGVLGRFASEAQDSLNATAQEIRRTQEWLSERRRYWQREVRLQQKMVARARAALVRCENSGYYDREGYYHDRDCRAYERALYQAQRALREAENELHIVQQAIKAIKPVAADYYRQAQRLTALLRNDLPKATALLGRSVTTLRSYTAMSVGSNGGASTGGQMPSLSPATRSASTDSSTSSVPVLNAIRQGIEEGAPQGLCKMQGQAGELVALLSGNRFDLNQLELPMKGGNFPVYDNLGSASVASVKVRGLHESRPSESTIGSYLRDFLAAIGKGSDSSKFYKAANLLFEVKSHLTDVPMPDQMKEVQTVEEMKEYLYHHAELQIPINHLNAVQEALEASILEFPEKYGLDEATARQQIKDWVLRIISLDATTNVILQEIEAYKERRRNLRK